MANLLRRNFFPLWLKWTYPALLRDSLSLTCQMDSVLLEDFGRIITREVAGNRLEVFGHNTLGFGPEGDSTEVRLGDVSFGDDANRHGTIDHNDGRYLVRQDLFCCGLDCVIRRAFDDVVGRRHETKNLFTGGFIFLIEHVF